MKILIVSPFYAPYSLVGANRMMSLSRCFVEKGHDVSVWAHDIKTLRSVSGEASLCSEVPEGVKTLRFSVSPESKSKWLYPFSYIRQLRQCRKAAKKQLYGNSFDLILMSCGPTYQQAAVLCYAKKHKISLVMDMRDMDVLACKSESKNPLKRGAKNLFWYFWQYLPEKHCMKYASRAVFVVPGAAYDAVEAYGIPHKKTAVIYNGYDEVAGDSAALSDDGTLRVGLFGKLMLYSPERGAMLLEALELLNRSGIKAQLWHVGQQCRRAEELIQVSRYSPDIYLALGPRDYPEGMALMRRADILAVEYLDPKGLGTKIFDYISLNKPVVCVAPKDCALSRLTASFENGFACDSTEEIIDAITKIIDQGLTVLDSNAELSVYSRKKQNEKYEKLLTEAAVKLKF